MKNMKLWILSGILALLSGACSEEENKAGNELTAPSDLYVERIDAEQISLRWSDNSNNEEGFILYIKGENENDFRELDRLGKNTTEYIYGELEENISYYFKVCAFSGSIQSDGATVLYRFIPFSDEPKITLGSVNGNDHCISISYLIQAKENAYISETGTCWSDDGSDATIKKNKQAGPAASNGETVFQVLPNVLFEYGKEYKIRAYMIVNSSVVYSDEQTVTLGNAGTSITFNWEKIENKSLPEEIQLFQTSDQLNGRPFKAWYAVADMSKGNLEFRVNLPSEATTVANQAKEFGSDCILLVNGGYFYNGQHIGVAVIDGASQGSISAARGSLYPEDAEYESMYNVTKGIFGIDANGMPAVYWVGSTDSGQRYYNQPLPSVVGEAKYPEASDTNPSEPVAWNPVHALSAGPVLLKNGVIPFDFSLTSKGFYMTNYEVTAKDIFRHDDADMSRPDRTAIGYTDDGKLIFFVCDGRIEESRGANLYEVAQIMKGLGCKEAVNMDGGGSSTIVIGGERINDGGASGYARPVVSTLGIFKKN